MKHLHKEVRSLLAASPGWTATRTSGGHIRLVHTSGALVHASTTPSDRKNLTNLRALMRRAIAGRPTGLSDQGARRA